MPVPDELDAVVERGRLGDEGPAGADVESVVVFGEGLDGEVAQNLKISGGEISSCHASASHVSAQPASHA